MRPTVAAWIGKCTVLSPQCTELSPLTLDHANRYIARQLWAFQNETVPIGIIQSDVPGTPIQKWTSAAAIRGCSAANATAADASVLYNTMIYPLLKARQAFSSIVWYQGESNVGAATPWDGAAYYTCALPAMIKDWRSTVNPTVYSKTPFFVVELAAYCNNHDESTFMTFCDANTTQLTSRDIHLPALRVAQSAALTLPNVYIESAMDLGSLHPLPYASIHPTNKQEVARRLALAMRHAVYGDDAVVYEGPRPVAAKQQQSDPTNTTHMMSGAQPTSFTVTIAFSTQANSGGLALNTSAACTSSVLGVYCPRAQLAGFEVLSVATRAWGAPTTVALTHDNRSVVIGTASRVSRVRYAYADWPVVSLRNADGGLPARVFDLTVTQT